MAGILEKALKAAIDEILDSYFKEAKFGYFLSKEAKPELIENLYQLIETSRNLKSNGDKMLGVDPRASIPKTII